MPIAPPRACDTPGCKNAALPHSWRCAQHTKNKLAEDNARSRLRNQNSEHRHLYDSAAWRKHLKPFIRARDPLCKLQITPLCKQHGGDGSTVVDHIIDHRGDPKLFFDPANCQGVCEPCHNAKTKPHNGKMPEPVDEKLFHACENQAAIDRALADTEDLDDVEIPQEKTK